MMITIRVGFIPPFIRQGLFYESLDTEERHSEIEVPESCYADKDEVTNITDFAKMIKVMSFWGLHTIPLSVIEFCDSNHHEVWMNVLADNEKLPVAQSLVNIFAPSASLEKAIELEVTEVVEYFVQKRHCGLSVSAAVTAAKVGRLDYLIVLYQCSYPWDESVSNQAATNGHLGCLQYLHENGCPWTGDLFISAATCGHLNCIQYACEQGLRWADDFAGYVATCGQLNILKYVVEHGGMLDRTVAYTAAKHNHQECLQYLLEVNCPVDHYTAAIAAEYGHIECLKVLHQQLGTAWWDVRITGSAAIGGQLECLQFLHETGCPWDERTTSCAASKAKIDCLRYAFEHNCPFDPDIIMRAVRTVSPDSVTCLQYLIEERGLQLENDAPEIQEAFAMGNYYALQYFIDLGRPFRKCKVSEDQLESGFVLCTFLEDDTYEYDSNLVKCIACIISNGWNLARNGAGLRKFLKDNADKLPLSAGFVSSYRYTMFESLLLPFR